MQVRIIVFMIYSIFYANLAFPTTFLSQSQQNSARYLKKIKTIALMQLYPDMCSKFWRSRVKNVSD